MKVYKKDNKFYMEDQGTIIELSPNKDYYLALPANSVNRRWVSCAKVDKSPNECIEYGDEVKVARNINVGQRKGLEEYLSPERKALYLELVEEAKRNREEANKKTPMSEIEKKERLIEKYMAQIAELKAQQNGGSENE